MAKSEALINAVDNLGWTSMNDDEAWKDAAWGLFKVMRDEIDRLTREVEVLTPQESNRG